MDASEIDALVRQINEAQMAVDPRVAKLESAAELTMMQYAKANKLLSDLNIHPSKEIVMAMLQVLSTNYSAITIANAMPE